MDLDNFAAIARGIDWLEEPLGFSMDVDHAVYTESKTFKMMAPGRPQSREAMVFELEWLGQGDALSDVDADFFRMYGKVAEDSQFVTRRTEGQVVLYQVTLGDESHGHRATFRIAGPRIARVVARYEQARREIRGERPQGGDISAR
jgi:hypothetical protein